MIKISGSRQDIFKFAESGGTVIKKKKKLSNFEIWQFFVNNKAGYQSFKITLYCNYTRVHMCDCFDDLSILESNYFAHYRKKKKYDLARITFEGKKRKKKYAHDICSTWNVELFRVTWSSNELDQGCVASLKLADRIQKNSGITTLVIARRSFKLLQLKG